MNNTGTSNCSVACKDGRPIKKVNQIEMNPLAIEILLEYDGSNETLETSFSEETAETSFSSDSADEEEDSLHYNHMDDECPICFATPPMDSALILEECGHAFCLPCLKSYINAQVEMGRAANIVCPLPASQCGKCVQQRQLQDLLGKDEYERLDKFALQSAIAADPTFRHCPTPDCSFVFACDTSHCKPSEFFCPVCSKSSCIQCDISPFHRGMTCDQYRDTQARRNKKRRFLLLLRKVFYRKESLPEIKTCKQCGAWIMKKGGCNKMKCRCGYRFCFVCGSENAKCSHTLPTHGFIDNVTGRADFTFR
mmetsp:Transcript_2409/g.3789  ORF Transcript_2409/g.3789 Transcript_2409/m.3789 type:complete len:309 (+) Transcript_2409:689-1615(+)